MEKKQNGYFKAVSIISLVLAIVYTIFLGFIIMGIITDFDALVLEVSATFEDTAGIPGSISSDILSFTITMLVLTCIYIAGYATVHYLAYFKLKKYSNLTNEEARRFSGRIVAWIVIIFLFSGLLNGILMLCGYTSITKEQINADNDMKANEQNSTQETINKDSSLNTKDLDTMIERLERLNKIKEMGGLTEEEYEALRKKIVDSNN